MEGLRPPQCLASSPPYPECQAEPSILSPIHSSLQSVFLGYTHSALYPFALFYVNSPAFYIFQQEPLALGLGFLYQIEGNLFFLSIVRTVQPGCRECCKTSQACTSWIWCLPKVRLLSSLCNFAEEPQVILGGFLSRY